jgi:bacterioferritin
LSVVGGVHPRVLGYLGRALTLEYSAVQQYMTQTSLVALWGQAEAADRFRRETVEELRHAERIIERMLTLGVAPAASQLRPVRAGADLNQLLHQDLELEEDLVLLYGEAARFCTVMGDESNGSFFHDLCEEERQHGDDLKEWLRQIDHNGMGGVDQRATF